jgi:hypothetical protein
MYKLAEKAPERILRKLCLKELNFHPFYLLDGLSSSRGESLGQQLGLLGVQLLYLVNPNFK